MASTFCFRVAQPSKASAMIPALLEAGVDPMQTGGCNASRIMSNATFVAGVSDHPACAASCVERAIFGAMGTPSAALFVQVWRHIFASALYSLHEWTIKLDMDTVVLPHRLRSYLALFDSTEAVSSEGRLECERHNSLLPARCFLLAASCSPLPARHWSPNPSHPALSALWHQLAQLALLPRRTLLLPSRPFRPGREAPWGYRDPQPASPLRVRRQRTVMRRPRGAQKRHGLARGLLHCGVHVRIITLELWSSQAICNIQRHEALALALILVLALTLSPALPSRIFTFAPSLPHVCSRSLARVPIRRYTLDVAEVRMPLSLREEADQGKHSTAPDPTTRHRFSALPSAQHYHQLSTAIFSALPSAQHWLLSPLRSVRSLFIADHPQPSAARISTPPALTAPLPLLLVCSRIRIAPHVPFHLTATVALPRVIPLTLHPAPPHLLLRASLVWGQRRRSAIRHATWHSTRSESRSDGSSATPPPPPTPQPPQPSRAAPFPPPPAFEVSPTAMPPPTTVL